MCRKWFTLLELLIVMIIIGILSVILLRTYTSVTQTTFRVQQTRYVHQEVLRLVQVVQNFADRASIDFSQYDDLSQTQWLVSTLYLQGQDGDISLYMTWDCPVGQAVIAWTLSGKCRMELNQSWTKLPLTQGNRIQIRNLVFKIIPFASSDAYLQQSAPCPADHYLQCVHKPWFWMLLDAYSDNYSTQRTNNIHVPLQIFF